MDLENEIKKVEIEEEAKKDIKCPSCGNTIEYLFNIQSGTNCYKLLVNKEGQPTYDFDNFEVDDNVNVFCCPECNYEICNTQENAISFLMSGGFDWNGE